MSCRVWRLAPPPGSLRSRFAKNVDPVMPSRVVSVFIVVFWLACVSWLFVREVWPRFASGDPPRFAIDRMDNTRRNPHPLRWVAIHVSGDQERKYPLATRVEYDRDTETYSFRALIDMPRSSGGGSASALERMQSIYRVDTEGRMYAFSAEASFRRLGVHQTAFFDGTVQGNDCSIAWSVVAVRELNRGVAEVGVSRTGSILLPLHPLPRVRGLKPGMRWGLPLLNHLIVPATPGSSPRMVWVNAEVRPVPEVLQWNRHEVSCHVIDYEGDDVHGSVWVEEGDDARMLRIEFRLGHDQWIIVRE